VTLASDLRTFTLYFSSSFDGFGTALSTSHFELIGNVTGAVSLAGATLIGPSPIIARRDVRSVLEVSQTETAISWVGYDLTLAAALSLPASGDTFVLRFLPPGPRTPCATVLGLASTSGSVVIGNGTAASCTESALRTAAEAGGIVTFNCGPLPVSIPLTSHLNITNNDVVIDGGGMVTLEAVANNRILIIDQWANMPNPIVRLQQLTIKGGRYSGTPIVGRRIGTGSDIGGGGAILTSGGTLEVFRCNFIDNIGITTQQDAAGGAIYLNGYSIYGTHAGTSMIEESAFYENACASGGAVGSLGANFTLNNVIISSNLASGNSGNPGNGGNGGAVYIDGSSNSAEMCGVIVSANQANMYGKAFFRVGYDDTVSPPSLHLNVSNSFLYKNYGPVDGFATIYAQSLSVNLVDTTLANNSAPLFSGLWFANYVQSSLQTRRLYIDGAEFYGNVVEGTYQAVGALDVYWGTVNPIDMQIRNSIFSNNNGAKAIAFKSADAPGVVMANTLVSTQASSSTLGCSLTSSSCDYVYQTQQNGPCCSNTGATNPVAGTIGSDQLGAFQDNGCLSPSTAIGNATLLSLINMRTCAASSQKFANLLMNANSGAVARPGDFYFQFVSSTDTNPTIAPCFRNGALCKADGMSCSNSAQCSNNSCVQGVCCTPGVSCPAATPVHTADSPPRHSILFNLLIAMLVAVLIVTFN